MTYFIFNCFSYSFFLANSAYYFDFYSIYFCNNKRKKKALFYVYEKLARHYRAIRKRNKAAFYAKVAIKNGGNTPVLNEILKEEKMSKARYALRIIGKLI